VLFKTVSGLSLPDRYTFIPEDNGIHLFELSGTESGEYRLQVSDTGYPSASVLTDPVTIKEARSRVESKTVSIGNTQVLLRIHDSSGMLVDTDNATTFTVQITEEKPDGSASSDAENNPVTVKNGTGYFSLENTQPETVEISVFSDPELPATPGSIRFIAEGSNIGEGGLRITFWKEEKE